MPSSDDLDRLAEHHQLTVRYVDASTPVGDGMTDALLPYPISPNGSMRNIAGICDSTGLVFGLMPHPEAIYARWLHPTHTRHEADQAGGALDGWEGEGLQIFRNAVEYVKQRA